MPPSPGLLPSAGQILHIFQGPLLLEAFPDHFSPTSTALVPHSNTTEGSLRAYILLTRDAKLLPHSNLLTAHNHLIKSYYPHFTGQKTEISSTASQGQTPTYSHHSNAWPLNHDISHFPPTSELGLPSYAGLYSYSDLSTTVS